MRKLVLVLCALVSFAGLAQRENLNIADKHFHEKKYHEAITYYKLALEEDFVVNQFYMNQQIAKTYLYLFDYENALIWYGKLMEYVDDNSPENIYDYGQLLRNAEKYDEAKKVFNNYVIKSNKEELKHKLIAQCEWPIENKQQASKTSISKTNLETGSRSFGVEFYNSGLLFSVPQKQDFNEHTVYYNLSYVKTSDNVNFDPPKVLSGEINHIYYEGTPSLSKDGKSLYYAANASETKKYKIRKKDNYELREDGLNILKIFVAHNINGAWSDPVELNINSKDFNCAFPHISDDGNTLFFASDKPGGFGKMDIYKCQRKTDSTWTTPINLGREVNSYENETYPYMLGNKLFFSSKGHEGFGGSDIYQVTLTQDDVVDRENLGKPVNSSKDDFAYIIENNSGYFSSNREGTHGYDNVYYFKNEPAKLAMDTLRGEIIDQVSKQPIEGVLVELFEKQEDGSYKKIESKKTGKDGKWEFVVHPEKEYQVKFSTDGYDSKSVDIPINDGNSPSNREKILSQLNPLELNKV